MHITLGKGLTNADIEEVVTKCHQNHSLEDTYYALHKVFPRRREAKSVKKPCKQCVIVYILETTSRRKKFFLLVFELDQCSVHHLVPFLLKRCDQTGATIDTSWGQLMVSPHGGDNVLAQV